MVVVEWIRFLIGGGLLLCGLGTFIIEIIGVFRFRYVLNRMHAAAIGDTLGIGFALLGLIVMNGLTFTSLKLLLVIVFLWFSSPVSSHLIARLEVSTNEESGKHYRVMRLEKSGRCREPAGEGGSESRAKMSGSHESGRGAKMPGSHESESGAKMPGSHESESRAKMSGSHESGSGAMAGRDPEGTGEQGSADRQQR